MVADEPEDCPPAKVMMTFEVDHRPAAREIEHMILEGFHVSKAMRPEIAKMALRIAVYAGGHYLDTSKLMRGETQGSA